MPIDIAFERGGLGVLITISGDVTAADLAYVKSEIYRQDPDRKLRYRIFDTTRATSNPVTGNEVRALAEIDAEKSETRPPQLVAIVGDMTMLKGADQLYAIYAAVLTNFETESFGTLARARDWVEEWLEKTTESASR